MQTETAKPETLAQKYRRERPATYENKAQWVDFIRGIDDRHAFCMDDRGRVKIQFSDGSTHVMGYE